MKIRNPLKIVQRITSMEQVVDGARYKIARSDGTWAIVKAEVKEPWTQTIHHPRSVLFTLEDGPMGAGIVYEQDVITRIE